MQHWSKGTWKNWYRTMVLFWASWFCSFVPSSFKACIPITMFLLIKHYQWNTVCAATAFSALWGKTVELLKPKECFVLVKMCLILDCFCHYVALTTVRDSHFPSSSIFNKLRFLYDGFGDLLPSGMELLDVTMHPLQFVNLNLCRHLNVGYCHLNVFF